MPPKISSISIASFLREMRLMVVHSCTVCDCPYTVISDHVGWLNASSRNKAVLEVMLFCSFLSRLGRRQGP